AGRRSGGRRPVAGAAGGGRSPERRAAAGASGSAQRRLGREWERAAVTTIGPVSGTVNGKPPVRGRIYYLLGGTLPSPYREWVAADNTGRGWRWREALRLALLSAPFAVVFLLLPGRLAARATMAICIVVAAAVTGIVSAGFFRNRRLVQHGLPPVVAPEEDPERDEPLTGQAPQGQRRRDHDLSAPPEAGAGGLGQALQGVGEGVGGHDDAREFSDGA
ncbi:MAG: DUF5313 family protein, partial [Frankia sp.]